MIKAFNYMFKEFDFKKNILPLWIMIFIAEFIINFAGLFSPYALSGKLTPIFHIILLIGFLTTFIPCGYGMECLNNYLSANDSYKLAEINIKKNFIKGAKFMLSLGLLIISLFLIFIILGTINSLFIKLNWSPLSYLMTTLSCLILLVTAFVFIASVCKFSKTDDILSFLKLPPLYNTVNENVGRYFIGFIIFAILMIFFCLIRVELLTLLIQRGFILMTLYSVLISMLSTYFALIFLYLFRESINPNLI